MPFSFESAFEFIHLGVAFSEAHLLAFPSLPFSTRPRDRRGEGDDEFFHAVGLTELARLGVPGFANAHSFGLHKSLNALPDSDFLCFSS